MHGSVKFYLKNSSVSVSDKRGSYPNGLWLLMSNMQKKKKNYINIFYNNVLPEHFCTIVTYSMFRNRVMIGSFS